MYSDRSDQNKSEQGGILKFCKIIPAFVLITVVAWSMASAEVADRIVAVINDDVITQRELDRAFEPFAKNIEAGYRGPDRETVVQKNKEALLQRLIDQILIEQEAKKSGMGLASIKDEEAMELINSMLAKNRISLKEYLEKMAQEGKTFEMVLKDVKTQMLRMRMLRREVQAKILVTDEEIGEYYNKHRQDYEGKEAVNVRQILLPAPADMDRADRENVKRQALQLRERILKGESFEMMAAQYSKGPAAAQGGDIGFVEKGVILPAVEQAAFSLPVGQLSDVIETELGYHIIVVVDKRGAGIKPLPVVRNEIKSVIEDEKISKKYDEWIDGIRRKSFIDVRL